MQGDIKTLMVHVAQCGYHVFPLLKRYQKGENKAGTPPGWNHNKPSPWQSSTDINTVLEWSSLPDLVGYGVNPRGNNVFILDVDCGKSADAITSLRQLKDDFGLPKSSLTVKSKSGGYHFYYEHPDFDIVSSTAMLPGIDIRANNSYVHGPDSKGDWKKGFYTIVDGDYSDILQPLNDKFVEFLRAHHAKKFRDNTSALISDPQHVTLLSGEIPESIPEGERHMTLLRLIGSWCRAGYPRANILSLLNTAFTKCEPGPPSNIDAYIDRVDDTLAKASFSRTHPEPLQFFLDNAIHVRDHDAVYEIPQRRVYYKGLNNLYAKHHYWIENDKGKQIKRYAYKEWLEHKDKKEVDGIGYKPTRDIIFRDGAQNCEVVNVYVAPNLPQVTFDEVLWQRFVDFCKYLFGEKYEFMMDWAAHQVQRPHQKLQFATAIISESRGVGKNLFLKILSDCIGKHNAVEFRLHQLIESHVEYPLSKHLVIVNEADRDISDVYSNKQQDRIIEEIKTLITEDYVSVNPKFVRISSVTSFVNYVFTSNNLHAIPLDQHDRRFEVVLCDVLKKDKEYYAPLYDILRHPEKAAVIRKGLENREITLVDQSYSADRIDSMKQQVILAGKSFIDQRIEEAINNKESVFKYDVITADLFGWFVIHHVANVTQSTSQNLFKKYCKPIYRANAKQPRGLKLPSPAVEYKGQDYRPATTKTQNIYTCRDAHRYRVEASILDTQDLSLQFHGNYKASQPTNLTVVTKEK